MYNKYLESDGSDSDARADVQLLSKIYQILQIPLLRLAVVFFRQFKSGESCP